MRLAIVLTFLTAVFGLSPARADVNVKTCAAEPGITDVAYGDLVNCEISPVSDSDLFRFSGQAGDKVDIDVLRYTSNADPCLRVIQPGGTIGNYACARAATAGINITLTETGVHTIQVVDGNSDESFTYGLTLMRVAPGSTNASPIGAFGTVLSGSITPRGDTDFYTFTGVAGDTIPITVSRVSTNADECFRVIQPNGTIGAYTCVRGASASADVKLTQSGLHTIQIADGNYDETFPYNLSVQCLGVCPPQSSTPKPVDVSPAAGGGSSQSMVFTFGDADGRQDLDVVNVLINNFLDGRNACYLAYSRPLNVLYLVNDLGTGLLPGLVLNGSGSTGNSQCTITGAGSSASGSGSTLTLMLNMSFASAFAGNRIVYLAARDAGQANSGWQALGAWAVPNALTIPTAAVSVSPARGAGLSRSFAFTFSDTKGVNDLGVVNILINDFLDGRNACYLAYSRASNVLYLVNDAGSALLPGLVLSGSGTLSNSQCSVTGAGSSASGSGNTLTLTLNTSFASGFGGNRVIYMAARDLTDANNSGWQALGSWTVQ